MRGEGAPARALLGLSWASRSKAPATRAQSGRMQCALGLFADFLPHRSVGNFPPKRRITPCSAQKDTSQLASTESQAQGLQGRPTMGRGTRSMARVYRCWRPGMCKAQVELLAT